MATTHNLKFFITQVETGRLDHVQIAEECEIPYEDIERELAKRGWFFYSLHLYQQH